jgi:hypothetical protein
VVCLIGDAAPSINAVPVAFTPSRYFSSEGNDGPLMPLSGINSCRRSPERSPQRP